MFHKRGKDLNRLEVGQELRMAWAKQQTQKLFYLKYIEHIEVGRDEAR